MRFYIPLLLLSVMQLVKSRDLFLLIPWFLRIFSFACYDDGMVSGARVVYRRASPIFEFQIKILSPDIMHKEGRSAFHCCINRYSVLYIIEYSIKMEVDTIARLDCVVCTTMLQ